VVHRRPAPVAADSARTGAIHSLLLTAAGSACIWTRAGLRPAARLQTQVDGGRRRYSAAACLTTTRRRRATWRVVFGRASASATSGIG